MLTCKWGGNKETSHFAPQNHLVITMPMYANGFCGSMIISISSSLDTLQILKMIQTPIRLTKGEELACSPVISNGSAFKEQLSLGFHGFISTSCTGLNFYPKPPWIFTVSRKEYRNNNNTKREINFCSQIHSVPISPREKQTLPHNTQLLT